MAGHSKWANIKHRKGAADAKRSQQFTKLIREITIAAKLGGPDPESNPRLRLAIRNAKGVSMPKDNIERAINKASGVDGADFQDVTYEGYANGGVAIYIEGTTDNINRTVGNVRSYFSKNGGNLGTNGSLEFIFDQKGSFEFELPEGMDRDDLELEMIDAGAEELDIEEGIVSVTCAREDFGTVSKKLDDLNIETKSAGLVRIPKVMKQVDAETALKVFKFIDVVEEDDDVQKVYHNIEFNEELKQALENQD